jgi:hypothetical protein
LKIAEPATKVSAPAARSRDVVRLHAAVDLQADVAAAASISSRTRAACRARRDEALPAEARVDRHQQHQVELSSTWSS